MSKKVVYREYKVLLKNNFFIGNDQELLKNANQFWHAFSQGINNITSEVNGNLDEIADQRFIRFYDGMTTIMIQRSQ